MDQTIRLRCCCHEKKVFHVRVEMTEGQSPNMVSKIVSCPYCDRKCVVRLLEDQVDSIKIMRGHDVRIPCTELPPGALLDNTFPTMPADEPEDQTQ